ncbi:MAG: LysM peptidoglycan-binding domain-containing protein [Phycisphaerales bacterium]|nr:LysM peptidoglycan-binding domain-containing protein [Phycisphaerales bacterium]
MARETKVALVVGLAFIICFAAILTRRGQSPRAGGALGEQLHVDLGTVSGGGVKEAAARAASQAVEGVKGIIPAVASGASDLLTQGANALESATTTGLPGVRPGGSHAVTPSGGGEGREKLEQMLDQESRRRRGASQSDPDTEPTPKVAANEPGSAAPGKSADEPARAMLASHTVSRGDTLMKIARQHYGADWKRGLESILSANESTLRDPDEIREGAELQLPRLALKSSTSLDSNPASATKAPRVGGESSKSNGAALLKASIPDKPAQSAAGGIKPKLNEKPKSPAQPPGGKASPAQPRGGKAPPAKKSGEYELKPGDTYVSIARAVLGDEKRWKEIHELNKDRIPDPTGARAGASIRLPSGGKPAARVSAPVTEGHSKRESAT